MRTWQSAALAAVGVSAATALLTGPWQAWAMRDTQAARTTLVISAPAPTAPLPSQPVTTWTVTPMPPSPTATTPAPATSTASTAPAEAPATGGPVVYLTIDDGPDRTTTPQVLEILRRYGVRATFFMIGEQAAANPDLVAAVRADGHAIGNHTYTHPWLTNLPTSAVRGELTRASTAIGGPVTCMRAPGGLVDKHVRSVARELDLPILGWTHDTRDWTRPGSAAIVKAATNGTLSRTRPRIVLIHDGGGSRTQTVDALPRIIEKLRSQGAVFETVPACRA